MIWHVSLDGGTPRTVELLPGGRLRLDGGRETAYECKPLGNGLHLLTLDGRPWILRPEGDAIAVGDQLLTVLVESGLEHRLASTRDGTTSARGPATTAIKAPMPGVVSRIAVSLGQAVQAGDLLLVLEAMKMANEVRARAPAKVLSICVSAGQAVKAGEGLLTLG